MAVAVALRPEAGEDVRAAVARYRDEAGGDVANAFIDALEHSLAHISEHPASGSARYATELDLPGLRFWPVARFPYLVFYVQLEGAIDVWRVIPAQRDIPGWLQPQPAEDPGPSEVREQLIAPYTVEMSLRPERYPSALRASV